MEILDDIHRSILYELDRNSRQPIADLARSLHVKRDRIMYRIKKLESDGVIKGFTTAVNAYKFGLVVYKTYLRLERNEKRIASFVSQLTKHPRVSWIAECDGKWDLIFSIYARSPKEFFLIQEEVLFEFSDIINQFTVYTVVDAWCFRKSYLIGLGTDHYSFGGEPGDFKPDKSDFEVLQLLSEDSRLSVTEIGAKLKLSALVVKSTIDRLEKQGIIVGYPLDLDLTKIGMSFFKAQFHFDKYDRHAGNLLLEFSKTNPYITFYIRQIGDCLVEMEMEVEGFDQFNKILDDIRQRFSKFIRSIDTVRVRKQIYKWVPFTSDEFMSTGNRAVG